MAGKILKGVDNVIKGPKDKRETVAVSSLEGPGDKVLGLYFSAHWCAPCRGFTPQLAKWYNDVTSSTLKDKLNIVFVSSDRNEESFDDYFKDMPWLALPYDLRDMKVTCAMHVVFIYIHLHLQQGKLSKTYKVEGIPTLVFIDANTGAILNKNGRDIVSSDPNGNDFPWRSPTVNEVLSDDVVLVNKDNVEKKFSEMKGKPLAVYFSAHWVCCVIYVLLLLLVIEVIHNCIVSTL